MKQRFIFKCHTIFIKNYYTIRDSWRSLRMTEENTPQMSQEEQVGFHKGSISVLAKERQELSKMISIVEQLMQMHIESLKKLGVDLEAQAKQVASAQKESKPIEDILK